MKRLLIFFISFIFSVLTFSQNDNYIPLNIKPAYEKGTRSLDGKPGTELLAE
ncbi:MAG: hypothetical protein IPI19_09145 [Ignavibacteriales bacterium]|nr:hypothetical protein [Ignavibacteriales bacterium]